MVAALIDARSTADNLLFSSDSFDRESDNKQHTAGTGYAKTVTVFVAEATRAAGVREETLHGILVEKIPPLPRLCSALARAASNPHSRPHSYSSRDFTTNWFPVGVRPNPTPRLQRRCSVIFQSTPRIYLVNLLPVTGPAFRNTPGSRPASSKLRNPAADSVRRPSPSHFPAP